MAIPDNLKPTYVTLTTILLELHRSVKELYEMLDSLVQLWSLFHMWRNTGSFYRSMHYKYGSSGMSKHASIQLPFGKVSRWLYIHAITRPLSRILYGVEANWQRD